eukprot:scpid73570/ scgid32935/ 
MVLGLHHTGRSLCGAGDLKGGRICALDRAAFRRVHVRLSRSSFAGCVRRNVKWIVAAEQQGSAQDYTVRRYKARLACIAKALLLLLLHLPLMVSVSMFELTPPTQAAPASQRH